MRSEAGERALQRRAVAALSAAAALASCCVAAGPAAASVAQYQGLDFVETWSHVVSRPGPVSTSSPMLAYLAGGPAVVVGSASGWVFAYNLATGGPVPGWPVATMGHAEVRSTPSVAALVPGSPYTSVFMGVGGPAHPHLGGYEAFAPDGKVRWEVDADGPAKPRPVGVAASLAVGDLQGSTDVVAPSMGQYEDAIDARTGKILPGFPWFTSDSGFSTPALAPLHGRTTDIIGGSGQNAGLSFKVHYAQGGHLRVLSPTGNAGTGAPGGGLVCELNTTQQVDSSPAVGPFLPGGQTGIAVGTGTYWPGASDTDMLFALTSGCQVAWQRKLDGATESSPALAALGGGPQLDIVEATNNRAGGGSVYAFDGANGHLLWEAPAPGEVMGGVVTIDLGHGHQYAVATGTRGAEVIDGGTGAIVSVLEPYVGMQDCALVTKDPDGAVGLTLAGYDAYDQGVVAHFELRGVPSAYVYSPGAWPMFHRDPQLTGWSGTPVSA